MVRFRDFNFTSKPGQDAWPNEQCIHWRHKGGSRDCERNHDSTGLQVRLQHGECKNITASQRKCTCSINTLAWANLYCPHALVRKPLEAEVCSIGLSLHFIWCLCNFAAVQCLLQVIDASTRLEDVPRLYLQLCAGSREVPLNSALFATNASVKDPRQRETGGSPHSLLGLAGYADLAFDWTQDTWLEQLNTCAKARTAFLLSANLHVQIIPQGCCMHC